MAEAAPSSGASAPQSRALSIFSDLLFDIKDDMPEGKYIELCKAAQQVHNEKKPAPAPSASGNHNGYPMYEGHSSNSSDEDYDEGQQENPAGAAVQAGLHREMSSIQHFRIMLDTLRSDMNRLRDENEGLESQLDAATLTIDRLRERREFYAKATSALKSLLLKKKTPDSEILEAYARTGIKEKVLKYREGRKRARGVDEYEQLNNEFSD